MAARRLRLTRTLGPLVVDWMERELCHGPGDVQGQPLEFPDEVVRFIFHAYEVDEQGRRVVRRAMYSRPKGFAKSEMAAALACAEALGPVRFRGWDHDGRPMGGPIQAPIVKLCATEEEQGNESMYAVAKFMLEEGAVSRTPGLDVGLTRTYLPDSGKIVFTSSKAASKDGGKETFAVFDETHLYVSDELRRLHQTIRRNLMKRKGADPWGLETTTMFAPGENSVAEAAYEYAKKIAAGKIRDGSFLFDHREGPDPAKWDFESDEELRGALMEAYGPAAEWVDLERIIQEARDPQADRSDIIRYFVNRPAKREQQVFIKSATWDACFDAKSGVPDGSVVALGADGSRTWDTTVVAWASPHEDGHIDVGCRVFSVRDYVAHHILHEGGKIDYDDVESFIFDCFERLDVLEAAYDPRYLDRSAEIIDNRLPEASIIAVEPTSKHMREALGTFERLVIDGRLRHAGDPVIAAHLANCAVERGESKEVRRVRKLDARKPIDAVPALALAAWRASTGRMESSEPMVAFL